MIENPEIFIDTASSYENSEFLIGKYAPFNLGNRVITKIFLNTQDTFDSVVNKIKGSLDRVQQENFYSVLVHNSNILNSHNAEEILKAFKYCKEIGLTSNLGISCYESRELLEFKERYENFLHFQLPENVVDRRNFDNQNLLDLTKNSNEIFIRSIFLQGTVLSDSDLLPTSLKSVKEIFDDLSMFCEENEISKLKYCLDYGRSIPWGSGLVLGVNNFAQYKEILSEIALPVLVKSFSTKVLDQNKVDPRNWIDDE